MRSVALSSPQYSRKVDESADRAKREPASAGFAEGFRPGVYAWFRGTLFSEPASAGLPGAALATMDVAEAGKTEAR